MKSGTAAAHRPSYNRSKRRTFDVRAFSAVLILVCVLFSSSAYSQEDQGAEIVDEPEWTAHLYDGKLDQARKELLGILNDQQENDRARFGLATVRLLEAVEEIMQSGYRFGVRTDVDLPFGYGDPEIPAKANPQPVSYDMVRMQLKSWNSNLESVVETLDEIDGDQVKLPLRFGKIRIDFNGDGVATEGEAFWRAYLMAAVQRGRSAARDRFEKSAEQFQIVFDAADVYWLKGYCNFLMAFNDVLLAYDWEQLFNRSAHLVFHNPETPFPFLQNQTKTEDGRRSMFNRERISDLIAMFHSIQFPLNDPARVSSALEHLEKMTDLSRTSWEHIQNEQDNQLEWIPAPDQDGVLPGVNVTPEMVTEWHRFLDEVDELLSGDQLVPFWRNAGGRGVNLRNVFTNPKRFDLVYWIQGSAVAPYLEKGPTVKPETWQRLQQVFQGNFPGFALWFN